MRNHARFVLASDLFVVMTATFRVIYVFVALEVGTRRILDWNVTAHPTADWTAQQFRMIVPGDQAQRFVIHDRDTIYSEGVHPLPRPPPHRSSECDRASDRRLDAATDPRSLSIPNRPGVFDSDRDGTYGPDFGRLLQSFGTEERVIAPRSPWQNPFVERLIGTVRRECLDHVIVWNERSLRRTLRRFLAYYHEWRPHLALDKDAPISRAAQPATCGAIIQVPHLGGLHHHYERDAA